MKKTKIICSIGPASNDVDILTDMAIHGMNVARINFSHGDYEEKDKFLENIVKVRENTGKQVGILWDTRGPEFRTGKFENNKVELVPGDSIRIVKDEVLGNKERFSVNHPEALDNIVRKALLVILLQEESYLIISPLMYLVLVLIFHMFLEKIKKILSMLVEMMESFWLYLLLIVRMMYLKLKKYY